MNIEVHQKNLKESIDIVEECIQKGILSKRQRTIGFHCSVAAIDMLEIFLHENNLIQPGMQIKHDWFTSKKRVEERLPFDFPKKGRITSLIIDIEEARNLLCYGKPQPEKTIMNVISKFNELRKELEM